MCEIIKGVLVIYEEYDSENEDNGEFFDLPPLITQQQCRSIENEEKRKYINLNPHKCQCNATCKYCTRVFCYRTHGELDDNKNMMGRCKFCIEDGYEEE